MNFKAISSIILISLIAGSCSSANPTPVLPASTQTATELPPLTQLAIHESTIAPTEMPSAINPLTGLPVADASLLTFPAALVSISHFPATARPQAGLSFAPFVYEIYITEGATRFLTVFYGELPAPEVPLAGNCDVRQEPFVQTGLLVGNQVWHDANGNGIHEAWERGIEGVCVNLYDAERNLLQQTTTDTNGYYGFNVEAGKYYVAVAKPDDMEFALGNVGEEEGDSDVDQATGWSEALDVTSSHLTMDVGLIPHELPPPSSSLALAQVGPVRSGRLVYADIAESMPDSCLIYAFASSEVLEHLPRCFFVTHGIQGGGYMLDISKLTELIETREVHGEIDYTSNEYSPEPPKGGVPASRLDVYFAWLNQSAWVYDPLYESWWRYVDTSDAQTAGQVHPEIDRLTRRQLHFENVIVLFTEHDVVSPTNLDIHLEQNMVGKALLFRDGQEYEIRWSTHKTEEEKQSDRRKPIRFLYPDTESLIPLKPGKTWVIVVTPWTAVTEKKPTEWLLQFSQPAGAK